MKRKYGITVTMMAVTVTVLLIIAVTVTYSVISTMNFSRLSNWVNEISYIQDIVDEQVVNTSTYVEGLESITVNIGDLTASQKTEQFAGETIVGNNVQLYVLDLGKLNITNTKYGNLDSMLDVYAVSAITGRVYYAAGFEIDDAVYYTLTDNLKERFNLTTVAQNLSTVVFVPSVVGYSNAPVTVTVKVPKTFTNIQITTSNDQIVIGSAVSNGSVYEYQVNTNNIPGNYTVNVTYSSGVGTVTTKYTVNGYDNQKPVINDITSNNFVYKQVGNERIDYLVNISAQDGSGIKYLKYALGSITEANAYEYFKSNGNEIIDSKINLYRDTTDYTIYAEDNAGNYTVLALDVSKAINSVVIPKEWRENVTNIVDGVPIPKGFAVSPYGEDTVNKIKAENTKAGGLVIYELTDDEIEAGEISLPSNETQYTSWTTRNQYVWVPVAKDKFVTEFVRKYFSSATSTIVVANGKYHNLGEGNQYWEVIVDHSTNLPKTTLAEQRESYMSPETLAEVQAMYASVKEYGGFYIARYEAGVDTQRKSLIDIVKTLDNVHSKMNKIPYNYIKWSTSTEMNVDTGGAVEAARSLYTSNVADAKYTKYGVVSTLTYGVQWDRIIQWYIDTNAMTLAQANSSKDFGNYRDYAVTTYTQLNSNARYTTSGTTTFYNVTSGYTKKSGTSHILTTGALKAANVNNIYDIAGNMKEWTMEGYHYSSRVVRGGAYLNYGSGYPASNRDNNPTDYSYLGFRPALYIKIQ